jgi:hypothetical protein
MLRASLRNSDALETVSMSGPFSKLNIHSVGHWWKLDGSEMPGRRSSVCTAFHVTVADVASAKQADLKKCALRSTNITWHRVCLKKSKLAQYAYEEGYKGLADWTKHHTQEIQRIGLYVSARPSDQWTQLGHVPNLDSRYHSRSQKTRTLSSVDYVWELCFYVGTMQRICFFIDDFYSDSTLILKQ